MQRALAPAFYRRRATIVAPELLGKFLVVAHAEKRQAYMITETEAYEGPDDRASHAFRGRTNRTAVMYGPPGRWYVYFIYGMYEMLNIVTGPIEMPHAVLIRGVEGYAGPGKLTRGLGIDRQINGKRAERMTGVWIEDRGVKVPRRGIRRTPRIGVEYAGEWAKKPWRFVLKTPENTNPR